MKKYLQHLLKGEKALGIVFWFWFLTIAILFKYFINSHFEFEFNIFHTFYNDIETIFILLIYTLYTLAITVIVFRTTNKYKGFLLWKYIPQICVSIHIFLASLTISFIFINTFYYDLIVKKQISKIKNKIPLKIDKHVKLLNVEKNKNKIFYIFNIKDIKYTNKVSENIKEQTKNNLCKETFSQNLLKRDYILEYTYQYNNQNKNTKIIVEKKDCGKGLYNMDILKYILKNQS